MEIRDFDGDGKKLIPLAIEWDMECQCAKYGIRTNIPKFIAYICAMSRADSCKVIALYDDEMVVGLLVMEMFECYYSNDKMAEDKFWYVMPANRGIKSVQMIREAEKWAREKDCSHVMFSATNIASSLHDRVCGIYETLGMTKYGTTYLHTLGGK